VQLAVFAALHPETLLDQRKTDRQSHLPKPHSYMVYPRWATVIGNRAFEECPYS